MKSTLSFLFWTLVVGLTALLFWNSRGYLSDPATVFFYKDRLPEAPPAWARVLIPHVIGGMICLATGPLLFLPVIKHGTWHACLGTVYAVSSLGLMLPTGLWLSFSAHGGAIGRWGFGVTGGGMMVATGLGLWLLRDHDYAAHRRWMMRSYAFALSALTFRIVYLGGYVVGLAYEVNYPLSTWLSTVLNLCIVEVILRRPVTPQPHPYGERPDEKDNLPHDLLSVPAASAGQ